MFVRLTTDPAYSVHFKSYVALAPVTYVDHLTSNILKLLIDFHVEDIWEILGDHKFFFLSHKDVSPLYGILINSISGIAIDVM